jgi:hypothetical protein
MGQKPPLKLKEVWEIRIRLQLGKCLRELALFNLAIDSKLRGCDLVKLKVRDVAHGDQITKRATGSIASLGFRRDQRRIVDHPAVQGGMVNIDATLFHDFLQVTIGYAVTDIEKHSVQNDFFGKVGTFKTDHQTFNG